ncbi:MAG: lauroyl acyltransferase [Deltaproteobacteria bacterium HGW-Deltaproteobacteria-15]|jgi:predicted LPLAT superfamily acyltransferase|nr:MAG: lauroyl acyltransferase [Deltaproteobacteria bacterium HGW-Deltaproteobacteria-15]
MKNFLYRLVSRLSKSAGLWVFAAYAWIVSTGFFLFSPMRVRNSVRFYRILFPDRGTMFLLWCAWRQFHNFAEVFFDRFLLQEFSKISYTSEGWEHLEKARRQGRGGILLMSHMGNWEVAAHLLKQKDEDLNLLLYMGAKHKEQLERIQKESLRHSGIKIIAADEGGGSPLDIVEGVRFIDSGGLVSMTGDLVWKEEQRTVLVTFLGHEALLPATPHLLALLSGAPLFVFFAFRSGKGQYHFTLSEPIRVEAPSRAERTEAIRRCAQRYADILEETLRANPLQWYHFEPFLDSKQK